MGGLQQCEDRRGRRHENAAAATAKSLKKESTFGSAVAGVTSSLDSVFQSCPARFARSPAPTHLIQMISSSSGSAEVR